MQHDCPPDMLGGRPQNTGLPAAATHPLVVPPLQENPAMTVPPMHHDREMYRDSHDGTDMRRWLCQEPGCQAALADDTLAKMREMAWADQHGIQLPGVTFIGGDQP